METAHTLQRRLTPLRRRARLLVAERWALLGGMAGVGVGLVLVGLDHFALLAVAWLHLGAVVLLGMGAGWLLGFLRPPTVFQVARAAEHRLALKERLSSAVSLAGLAPEQPLVAVLVDDAARHLGQMRPSRLFPRRCGRRGQAFLGMLVLLAAAVVLPQLPCLQSPATRQERAQLRRQGARLVTLAQSVRPHRLPPDARKLVQQITLNMQRLGKDMQRGRLSRKQALLRLHRLEKQVQQARQQLSPSAARSPETAASQLRAAQARLTEQRLAQRDQVLAKLGLKEGKLPAGTRQLTPEQAKALSRLAQSLSRSPSQQLLDIPADLLSTLAELMAKGDMQEALKILNRLARKMQDRGTLEKLTPEEMKRLAQELRELAQALRGTDLDQLAKELLELAQALERGDLKVCEGCGGRLLGLGLGGRCAGLSALAGLGYIGPDQGTGVYRNLPHNIYRGPATRIATKHYDTQIPGQIGPRGGAYSSSEQTLGAPDATSKSQVPYYQVYSGYARAAESALDREEVPGPYRERVRTYFQSLQPESR